MGKKANMGILLGYSEVGYRVLINNKIIVARHVEIVERDIKCIGINYEEDYETERKANTDENSNDNVVEGTNDDDEENCRVQEKGIDKFGLKTPRKSIRERKSPVRYPENENYNIHVNYSRIDSPYTFEEALNSVDCKNWEKKQ